MKPEKVKAAAAEPLRQKKNIKIVADYIREAHGNGAMLRRMFLMGCNTGLRGGDLRDLRAGYFQSGANYFDIVEQKTKKLRRVYINKVMRKLYEEFENEFKARGGIFISGEARLFWGCQNQMIGVKYMHFIIKDACRQLGIKGNYGSHTMRKTFAHHVFKKYRDITLLKAIFNHADLYTTRSYLKDFKSDLRGKKTHIEGYAVYDVNLGME